MLTVDIDVSNEGELTIRYRKTLSSEYGVTIYLTVGQLNTLKNWIEEIEEKEG
jgi:hypothetical protein